MKAKKEVTFINLSKKIVDLVSRSFYLRLKIEQNCPKIILKLFQLAYIKKILLKYYFYTIKLYIISIK